MTDARILQGDVLRFAAHYRGEKFHALLCDPPYELNFMGKRWDKTGIAFRPETWAAFASLLHDGAFIMAFASSRGWHRQAVAIEDAGLIIHPMIGWSYGSGFPKATRVGKSKTDYIPNGGNAIYNRGMGGGKTSRSEPQTELARTWEGHRYGLQALKPSLEPILVAQKPYAGKPRERIVETGAGALWIDGGRIAANGESGGRWPANLVVECSCSAIDWCDCDNDS